MNISSIDTLAIGGTVTMRLFTGHNGEREQVFEYALTPMEAVSVAQLMMAKADEALTQAQEAAQTSRLKRALHGAKSLVIRGNK